MNPGRLSKKALARRFRTIFTGKERDTESDLDYFGARYYGSNMGRMMSPDPRLGSMHWDNPQSLNRYAYVLNNPLRYIDPDGLDCAYLNDAGTDIEKGGLDQNSNPGECGKNGGYWVDGAIADVHSSGNSITVNVIGADLNRTTLRSQPGTQIPRRVLTWTLIVATMH